MKKKNKDQSEKPEIYAINKENKSGNFQRRDFMKGLGLLTGSTLLGCSGNLKTKKPDETIEVLGDTEVESQNIQADNCKTLFAHGGAVSSLDISPNGKTLASGSRDNTIKLWSTRTGNLLRTLKGHQDDVHSVCFSPDGKRVASGSKDKTINLWYASNGKLLKTLEGHSVAVKSVHFSPDGKTLASGSDDNTIKLWSVPDGALLNTLEGHIIPVKSICFSPDGKTLASGSVDKIIKLWSVPEGTLLNTLEGHASGVEFLRFSPDGETLASGSTDKTIKLWSIPEGELLKTIGGLYIEAKSIGFSPDGKTLASGNSDHTIKLWSIPGGKLIKTFKGHSSDVESVCFSPDGKMLVSGGIDKTIKAWTWSSKEEIEPDATFNVSQNNFHAPFNNSGNYVAGLSEQKKIQIVDVDKNVVVTSIAKGIPGLNEVNAVALSNNKKYLITGNKKGKIKWINIEDKQEKDNFKAHSGKIEKIFCLHEDTKLITSATDGKTKIWSFPENELLKEFDGQIMALGKNDELFAILNQDVVSIWSFNDYEFVLNTKFDDEVRCLAFSPQSNYLIAGTRAGYIVHDYTEDKIISDNKTERPVASLAISSDEKYLVYSFRLRDNISLIINDFLSTTEVKKITIPEDFDFEYSAYPPLLAYVDDFRILFCTDKIRVFKFTDYVEDVVLSFCLYDKKELKAGTKGIKYKVGSQTMTLPCGSPLPAGAVCTCDCIRVGRPIPPTYSSTNTYTYYYTYWYPN